MSTRIEHGARWEDVSMPGRVTLNGHVVDRRAFLNALALTAAGAAVPFARAGAAAAESSTLDLQGPSKGTPASAIPEGTGHVDDMWGHWPRYAHPIPYTHVRHVPISLDTVAPADRNFVM